MCKTCVWAQTWRRAVETRCSPQKYSQKSYTWALQEKTQNCIKMCRRQKSNRACELSNGPQWHIITIRTIAGRGTPQWSISAAPMIHVKKALSKEARVQHPNLSWFLLTVFSSRPIVKWTPSTIFPEAGAPLPVNYIVLEFQARISPQKKTN